jgi:hypothetical protein
MPARSKIISLPADVRARLDAKLVTNSFSDYRGLAAWLDSEGYSISKDAVQRYGQEFKEKCEAITLATAQARAIVEGNPDDEGTMNDALIRLIQTSLFNIAVKFREASQGEEGATDPKALASFSRSVALLTRASVRQKEWMAEVRKTVDAKVATANSKIAEVAKSSGLSHETAQAIRNAILEIKV